MPKGLAKQLRPQQGADLIRFIIDYGKQPPPSSVAFATDTPSPQGESQDAETRHEIKLSDDGRRIRISAGSQAFATYHYRHDEVKRPFFANVKTPKGIQATRRFPPGPKDRQDHRDMHPGIWLAFGDVDGEDFWRNKGQVISQRVNLASGPSPGEASFTQLKSYVSREGRTICTETFRCNIRSLNKGYLIEYDSTFSAVDDREFSFGDQEEMGLGIRVATLMNETHGGIIMDSQGRQGAKQIWSQSSAWCDYGGIVDGECVGITVFCHPDNFRESWMHARDFGLIAANAFGRQAMKKGPASRIVVKPNEPLRIRYAVFIHDGRTDLENVYQGYVKRSP